MSVKKRKFDEISSEESDQETAAEKQVLSHAAQRRLRNKRKIVAVNGDDKAATVKVEKASTTVPLGTKKPNPTVHAIWVGNLSYKTTPDALRAFLGNAEDIKRIHMPTRALHGHRTKPQGTRGDSRGFAYVDFGTAEAKEAAIAKSEEHLDGRRLLIKDGNDFTGRPEKDGRTSRSSNPLTGLTKTARKILWQQKNPACATLFVGNLGFETQEEEIATLFGRVHPRSAKREDQPTLNENEERLLGVRMGTFEDTGKCKGFAFVDFKDQEFATEALTNPHNHFLNGRALVVEYASADAARRGVLANARKEEKKQTTKTRQSRRPQKAERIAAKAAARQSIANQDPTVAGDVDEVVMPHISKDTELRNPEELRKGASAKAVRRQKPGAALATARREKVSIVPSMGKKIVF